jgi:phospholipid/cholesterol/gamma-HCH transport system substrate-binding protein
VKRPRVLINLAIFGTLFLLMLIEATRSIISVGAISHPYILNADFPDSIGVFTHSEVDYLGVSIGEVASVSRIPGGVKVRMTINKSHKVPVGSVANLARKSAIGEQYVDFEPPAGYTGNHGPYYLAGYTVPINSSSPQSGATTIPLQFDEFLRSAANLLNSIPPDALATVVHELAVGLNGRTDSLRTLAESGDQLSTALVSKTQALNQLITTGTRLTQTVTDHRSSLGQSLTDLSQVAATLQQAQGDTSRLLDKGDPFLQQTADIVAGQKANLDCDLKYVTNLIDLTSTPRKLQELTTLLDKGPQAFDQIMNTIDYEKTGPGNTGFSGPWARVGLILNGENKATQYYPPPKEPPPPPPVPGCSSPLKPVAANYRPANAGLTIPAGHRGTPGAVGDGVILLCLGLVVMASLSWRGLARPGGGK